MKFLKYSIAVIIIYTSFLYGCKEDIEDPEYNPNPELLDVVETPCKDPELRTWLLQKLFKWGSIEVIELATTGELFLDRLAFHHALYFKNDDENEIFGTEGEYTDQIRETMAEIKNFWKIELYDILIVSLDNSILQDRDQIFAIYKTHYEYGDEKINEYTDSAMSLLERYPQYLDGVHPAFTFSQTATPDTLLAGLSLPAKILVGDGLLQGFEEIGYGDLAPQAILAHEYGHHMQYHLGVLTRGQELIPKVSRRIELMADAFSMYYLSHSKGAALEGSKALKLLEVFFNLGDCQFYIDGHHGTPDQRRSAAFWGYNLAQQSNRQILSAKEIARLFDESYEEIL